MGLTDLEVHCWKLDVHQMKETTTKVGWYREDSQNGRVSHTCIMLILCWPQKRFKHLRNIEIFSFCRKCLCMTYATKDH